MKKMVLLTYNIKPGSSLEDYGKFTREVDYPAIRQNPHVLDYSNYVIRRNYQGEEWFKHFDMMLVDDFDAYVENARKGDEAVSNHIDLWHETWGVNGSAPEDRPRNVHIAFAEEI